MTLTYERADKASFDLLRSKMEKLEAARKRFEATLSEGQKNQLAKAPNKTEAVLHLVDTATMDWCKSSETGSRTAKSIKNTFHQMCSSIDQHAVLLTMLPKEHEYVTIFFGAFNSIVAVSVNSYDFDRTDWLTYARHQSCIKQWPSDCPGSSTNSI